MARAKKKTISVTVEMSVPEYFNAAQVRHEVLSRINYRACHYDVIRTGRGEIHYPDDNDCRARRVR